VRDQQINLHVCWVSSATGVHYSKLRQNIISKYTYWIFSWKIYFISLRQV